MLEDGAPAKEELPSEEFKRRLFDGFREDHALMGRGFYELAQELRGGELSEAQAAARRIDKEAGSHIAFEEHDVYPLLIPFLGQDCVDNMYQDHREGRQLLAELFAVNSLADAERQQLLARTEKFQEHIEECANLFGAISKLPHEYQRLHECRLEWLRKRPRWTELE